MLLSQLAEGFLLDCQSRNLPPRTFELYTSILGELSTFLEDPDTKTITANDLRRFVVYEQERNRYAGNNHPVFADQPGRKLSAWTIHRYVRSLKTAFRWAVNEGVIEDAPSVKLRRPPNPHFPPFY